MPSIIFDKTIWEIFLDIQLHPVQLIITIRELSAHNTRSKLRSYKIRRNIILEIKRGYFERFVL